MRSRRQRTLEAYRDGQVSARQRTRVGRWLESDTESRIHLERSEALGRMVRESWSEGPPAPSPERLMAAIRPAMRVIDHERRAAPSPLQALLRNLGSSGFAPSFQRRPLWEWTSALGMVAASVTAAVVLGSPPGEVRREAQHLVAMPREPAFVGQLQWPSSVYDLAQGGETPLMVYEKEGATVIYLGLEPPPDDISRVFSVEDLA